MVTNTITGNLKLLGILLDELRQRLFPVHLWYAFHTIGVENAAKDLAQPHPYLCTNLTHVLAPSAAVKPLLPFFKTTYDSVQRKEHSLVKF